jgi:malonate decarboxylase epsilon subunit
MSLALLFPGQGSQQPGMLHTLPSSPTVDATVRDATQIAAGFGLGGDIDTAAALRDTTGAQLALVIAGVACARALSEEHGLAPAFVAGHSVGAFAAAVTAGVLTLREALTAVRLRGDLMSQACAGRDWGMAAITGLPIRTAENLVDDTATAIEPLWLANINSATQTVLSGTAAALTAAADAADRLGARSFERLDVSVASHCPLQAGTAERVAAQLAGLPRRSPTARYLTTTGGRSVAAAEQILDDLAVGVSHPVRWYDATRLMAELGVTCAVQMTPGRVLLQLLNSAVPAITGVALSEVGLAGAAAAARRAATTDTRSDQPAG